jgi:hypothetical protein
MVDLILEANVFMFSSPAFREELSYWHSKGAFGTPWLISNIAGTAITQLDLGSYRQKILKSFNVSFSSSNGMLKEK